MWQVNQTMDACHDVRPEEFLDVPLIWWTWFSLAKSGLLAKDVMQNPTY